MRRAAFALPLLLLSFAGCDGDDGPTKTEDPETPRASSSSTQDPAAPESRLVDSGFGRDGRYVEAVAIVENLSDHGGQTVTVNFDLLDDSGDIITSVSQVEAFTFPGQQLAVGGFADLGAGSKDKVASVEPTVQIEDLGTYKETSVDFGTADGTIVPNGFGGWSAKFTIKNPTSTPLRDPRIGIACRGADGTINGGGQEYPERVPANGKIVLDQTTLTVSGEPESCTAYIAGPF
jgi:hypothetical protein